MQDLREGDGVTLEQIMEAEQNGVTCDTGPMHGTFHQLAAEVRRLREENEILSAKVNELKKLESIDKILNRLAILEALDRFRDSIEAVKEATDGEA